MKQLNSRQTYDIESFEAFAISRITKSVNPDFTDEQKYKYVFDWCVKHFNYDYAHLNGVKATLLGRKSLSNYSDIIRDCIKSIPDYSLKSRIEKTVALLETLQNIPDAPNELLKAKQRELRYWEESRDFKKKHKKYRKGNLFETTFGVCKDFSDAYQKICKKLGLTCEIIYGVVDTDGMQLGHAWNAIIVNDEVKYVDISSAIHCKDRTNRNNKADAYFNVTEEDLKVLDGKNIRRLIEESIITIHALKEGIELDELEL